jgi:uncharacterized protein
MKSWKVKVINGINKINKDEWDACANSIADRFNPFVSYDFLNALEVSGSVTAQTGWAPHHLVLFDKNNKLIGAVAMYLKNHSKGEYVFDYNWAEAYERFGGQYYPKFQISIPFTPVTGIRILSKPGTNRNDVEKHILSACINLSKLNNISSIHLTFLEKSQWKRIIQLDFLPRIDQQYHWINEGYKTFDNFLTKLSSKKRKNINRERRTVGDHHIILEKLTGKEITETHWDIFFKFYLDTGNRKWGDPYLTRRFFSLLGYELSDRILLILCKRNDRYIAGALHFIGGDCLYGRYWGCIEHVPFLHFELCYYQAIEFAINKGLRRVEAGAQGEHKVPRGYIPTQTYNAHWFSDHQFKAAIAKYLESERGYVEDEIEYLNQFLPFRNIN